VSVTRGARRKFFETRWFIFFFFQAAPPHMTQTRTKRNMTDTPHPNRLGGRGGGGRGRPMRHGFLLFSGSRDQFFGTTPVCDDLAVLQAVNNTRKGGSENGGAGSRIFFVYPFRARWFHSRGSSRVCYPSERKMHLKKNTWNNALHKKKRRAKTPHRWFKQRQ